MKYYFLFLLISVFFFSCSDDDNNDDVNQTCTQAEWLGTYVGTEECNGDPAEDATVEITASGDSIIMEISNASFTIETPELPAESCTISESFDLGGTLILDLDATLDLDDLIINTNFAGSQCIYSVTRM